MYTTPLSLNKVIGIISKTISITNKILPLYTKVKPLTNIINKQPKNNKIQNNIVNNINSPTFFK